MDWHGMTSRSFANARPDATHSLAFIVYSLVPQGAPLTFTQVLARLPGKHTRGTVRNILRQLSRAELIACSSRRDPRHGGPPRLLFYRDGVAVGAQEVVAAVRNGAKKLRRSASVVYVPPVVTVIGPWRRDRAGNLVRRITGVEVAKGVAA
jgi:hypothetical protein